MKDFRNNKTNVPSFLPNEDKYLKFQDVLQNDEVDLKGRVNMNRLRNDQSGMNDESERYDVTRKTLKSKTDRLNPPYGADPFKAHMKKMEDKLKYGNAASSTNSPSRSIGGVFD